MPALAKMANGPDNLPGEVAENCLPEGPLRQRVINIMAANAGRQRRASQKLHSLTEAKTLVKDAALHDWLRRRQKRGADPKPRMYFTRFRRDTLEKCFKSIDRDGSGMIDKGELVFALTQLGLDTTHAHDLLLEGDRDSDGSISMPEFFALVATVSARQGQRNARRRASQSHELHASSAAESVHDAVDADAAMANSLKDLVDRASTFPIGLLANAQHISALVERFDPDKVYERRGSVEQALEIAADADARAAAAARLRVAAGSADELPANGSPAAPAVELGRDGHLKLPTLPPAGGADGPASSRASSAPLKSTTHTRWLQRGLTAKGSQLLGSAPSQSESTGALQHARPKPANQRRPDEAAATGKGRRQPGPRPRAASLPPISVS